MVKKFHLTKIMSFIFGPHTVQYHDFVQENDTFLLQMFTGINGVTVDFFFFNIYGKRLQVHRVGLAQNWSRLDWTT